MIRSLLSNGLVATSNKTIDKLDIFNDGSGLALYRFDGNTNDESGNFHGTENTTINYGGGVYERGITQIGANGNITFPTITGLNPINMTVSFWTKFSTYNTANNGAHIQISNGTYIFTLCIGTAFATDIVPMYRSGLGYHVPTTQVNRNTDTWMHITLAYNGSETALSMYINGILIPCTYSATGGVAPTAGFRLGSWINGTYTPNNNVAIDQLRIFNRALTLAEVSTLYNEVAPTSILNNTNPFGDGSLKALYQFEGNANDATGVYNGTADGTVTYSAGRFGNAKVCDKTALRRIQSTYTLGAKSSISFWVRRDTVDADQAIFASSSSFFFATNYTDQWIGSSPIRFAPSDATVMCPVIGKWYHIVMIDTGTVILGYRDGVKVANSAGYTSLSGFVFNYIGGYATTSANLVGLLDQVRIFNRALTPMEVACLYNETTPMEEPMSVQVDPFKDGSGKALYRLEGNSLDESGNYNGTPTGLTYGLGRFARCGIFTTASGSKIQVNNTSGIHSIQSFSISLWAKSNANTTQMWIDGSNGGQHNIGFGQYAIGNRIKVFYGSDLATWYPIETSTAMYDGVWHNYIFVKSGANGSIYIDGVLFASTDSLPSYTTNLGNVNTNYIGGSWSGGANFTGSIDQFRTFSKALTQSEVTALYNEI